MQTGGKTSIPTFVDFHQQQHRSCSPQASLVQAEGIQWMQSQLGKDTIEALRALHEKHAHSAMHSAPIDDAIARANAGDATARNILLWIYTALQNTTTGGV